MHLKSITHFSGLLLSLSYMSTLLGVGVCQAAPITYNVDQTIGGGSVVGTITTDGNTGLLATGDFIAWNLELNGVGASYNLTNSTSVVYDASTDVTATPTDLYFNFSGGDNGFLVFQVSLYSGSNYYCDAVTTQGYDCFAGASVVPQYYSDPSSQFQSLTGNQIIGSVTPLPSSWTMLIAGFIGLGFFASRRTKKSSTALAPA
jgi:hypothetical protein